MAQLNLRRRELIQNILERIAECEGGTVEVLSTREGDIIISLTPDIPPKFWCDECKKRAICKTKLMARWTRTTKQ